MSAIRTYDWATKKPRLVDEGASVAVPHRGYSLRGTAVLGRSGGSHHDPDRQAEYQREHVARKAAK